MDQTPITLLGLGLGFGILHALDADHIAAVSSLTNIRDESPSQNLRHLGFVYALRWALGHGGILLLLAAIVSIFHHQLPDFVPYAAERAVGLILILAGLTIVFSIYRQRTCLHAHHHDGVLHAHLISADKPKHHDHTPVLVGMVHGLAGSAPALALIPASMYAPLLSLSYAVIFSIGVLVGMVMFGQLLSYSQQLLLGFSQRLYDYSRLLIGGIALGLGSYWLVN